MSKKLIIFIFRAVSFHSISKIWSSNGHYGLPCRRIEDMNYLRSQVHGCQVMLQLRGQSCCVFMEQPSTLALQRWSFGVLAVSHTTDWSFTRHATSHWHVDAWRFCDLSHLSTVNELWADPHLLLITHPSLISYFTNMATHLLYVHVLYSTPELLNPRCISDDPSTIRGNFTHHSMMSSTFYDDNYVSHLSTLTGCRVKCKSVPSN